MCCCQHLVASHGNGRLYFLRTKYCASGLSFETKDGVTFTVVCVFLIKKTVLNSPGLFFFQNKLTTAMLSCSNCAQLYYLHDLQTPPTISAVPSSAPLSSAAPSSSASTPFWMMMGTFSNPSSTSQVTQKRMQHAQPPTPSMSSLTTSSF